MSEAITGKMSVPIVQGGRKAEETDARSRHDGAILATVDSPADLKRLSTQELERLAVELRQYVIDVVSRTGGHLAPSLGVVELTIALHYVFDAPRDRIV